MTHAVSGGSQAADQGPPWPVLRDGEDLVELAREAVIVFGLDGTIRSWNRAAEELYGWRRERALGAPFDALLSPVGVAAPLEALGRLRAQGFWAGKLRRATAGGEEIVVDLRWTLRVDAQGAPEAVVEYGSAEAPDEAVEALRASERSYRRLFHRAPIALMLADSRGITQMVRGLREAGVTDLDAYIAGHPGFLDEAIDVVKVVEVNALAMQMFGATDPTQLFRSVRHVWADAPDTFRRALSARFHQIPLHVEETRARTLDGRTVDVLFTLAFPSQDEFQGASLMGLLDIGGRLQAEAQLRKVTGDFAHAARLSTLGELTSSIAHEVKQPLSAILTNAQTSLRWLSRDEPNVEKAEQLAERIVESAQRAVDIIERVQDMAGKRETARTALDLNDLVRESLVFVRHESADRAVTIRTELAAGLPPIQGDRVQLQQIVVNLLVNAMQAMALAASSRREILLSTYADPRAGVVFQIQDSGPGIPKDHLEQVFDGFFTTKAGGMGIGLAICQSIITAHGGAITAANHPDGGAVFRFSLPAGRSPDARR